MTLGSFSRGALAEVDIEDVQRMLELDETLFVEHKKDAKAEGIQLAKSIGAFANTLGGWVLIGVHKGQPCESTEAWAKDDGPNVVDTIRDLLRGRLDPLPAFEGRRFDLPAGRVGLVRVYESTDTPHVHLESGAVFVRESAGDSSASKRRQPGQGKQGEIVYKTAEIRSQAQLVALAQRGREAAERVDKLLHSYLPLVTSGLGFHYVPPEAPQLSDVAGIFVRVVPYTLAPRFSGWSTTSDAVPAIRRGLEVLTAKMGFGSGWVRPHPAGMWIATPLGFPDPVHFDATGEALSNQARLVIDAAGLTGAARLLSPPREIRRERLDADGIAHLIRPVIEAATAPLANGEFLGRARCQIDLVQLGRALLVEHTTGEETMPHVPRSVDLSIPATGEEIADAAKLAANAFARGGGSDIWDPPLGLH